MSITQSTPLVGRRERKKAEVRQALQDATVRLAAQYGYDNVTIEAIADEVDVSARTFSNYFASKEEALFATDPDSAERLSAAILGRPENEPPLVVLEAVLVGLADQLADREANWRTRMQLVADNPQLRPRLVAQLSRFEEALADGVAARCDRTATTDPYAALVAAVAAAALRIALLHWRSENEQSLQQLLGELFASLAAGLPDPGRTENTRNISNFAADQLTPEGQIS